MTRMTSEALLRDYQEASTTTSPDLTYFQPGVMYVNPQASVFWHSAGTFLHDWLCRVSKEQHAPFATALHRVTRTAGVKPRLRWQENAASDAAQVFRSNLALEVGSTVQIVAPSLDLAGLFIESVPEEVLDWDASLKKRPAPIASGTLRVRLKYAGSVKPMPVESPWAE